MWHHVLLRCSPFPLASASLVETRRPQQLQAYICHPSTRWEEGASSPRLWGSRGSTPISPAGSVLAAQPWTTGLPAARRRRCAPLHCSSGENGCSGSSRGKSNVPPLGGRQRWVGYCPVAAPITFGVCRCPKARNCAVTPEPVGLSLASGALCPLNASAACSVALFLG